MVQELGSNENSQCNNMEEGNSVEIQNSQFAVNPNDVSTACGVENNDTVLMLKDPNIQVNLAEALNHLPTLGLTLNISDSFLDSLNMTLSQESNPTEVANSTHPLLHPMAFEKLKASNFPAMLLRIGTYEVIPEHEGDLVAKCYFAKKKLVWEVLHKISKRKQKIEIQWNDLMGIRATLPDNQPGILEIELSQPPSFFEEENPTPRKHTNWKPAGDFTGGQALSNRRHYIKFPPGSLDRHFEKLIQCENRLLELSRKPFPSLQSPFFPMNYDDFNGGRLEYPHGIQYPLPNISGSVNLPQQIHTFQQAVPSSIAVDFSSLQEKIYNEGVENPIMGQRNQGIRNFGDIQLRDQFQGQPSNPSASQIHANFTCQHYQMPNYPNPGNLMVSDTGTQTQVLGPADDQVYMTANMNYGQNVAPDNLLLSNLGTDGLLYSQLNAAIQNSNEISNAADQELFYLLQLQQQQHSIIWGASHLNNMNLATQQPMNNSFYSAENQDASMDDLAMGSAFTNHGQFFE